MKLNIGASDPEGKYKRGWINLDLVRHDRIQVQGSAFKLPFLNDSVDEIHCIHVLEHVTRDKQHPMLKEMHRVLKPGASAFIEVPNLIEVSRKMLEAYDNKNYEQARIWTVSVYGKSERQGMAHHWGFSSIYLEYKLIHAGFKRSVQQYVMISSHYKQEPVLLFKATK